MLVQILILIDLQLLKIMKIANVQIFVQKRGLASIFFHGCYLIYLGSISFEIQVIWRFAFCVIDLQLLKTMKIANVQIFVQKRGLASNFFSLTHFRGETLSLQ